MISGIFGASSSKRRNRGFRLLDLFETHKIEIQKKPKSLKKNALVFLGENCLKNTPELGMKSGRGWWGGRVWVRAMSPTGEDHCI